MRIESFDTDSMTVRVSSGACETWRLPGRLVSLAMVAHDCGLSSVLCELPADLPVGIDGTVRRLISGHPVLGRPVAAALSQGPDDFGYFVLSRDMDFLFLRDAENENKYSIFIASTGSNIDLASRCAYLVANVLGFTSLLSFEVRFSVYELLANIVEHGIGEDLDHWIQVDIQKAGSKLSVSIVDKGVGFDPTGEMNFDLECYLKSGKRRGLGLIMIRKLAERMKYEREGGFNKIFFEKKMSNDCEKHSIREDTMPQLTISEPRRLENGFYLIALEGDLDTKGSLSVEDLMHRLLEEKMHRIILDFEKVLFISSAGVGILIGLVSSLREEGGEVALANVTPKVRSVLSLLNLDDFFEIMDSQGSNVD